MNTDCIFCRIISGEIPSDILYQDNEVIALRDINPQAPTHILIMPKAHIPSLAEITIDHRAIMGHMVFVASELAMSEGAVKSALQRLRKRYRWLLRNEVAQTTASPDEVDAEIRYLLACLRG